MSTGSNLTTGQVAITTTAALIGVAKTSEKNLVVTNTGSTTVYLGSSTVTTSNGFPLIAGASLTWDDFSGQLYGVSASTGSVAFMEVN